MKEIKAQNSGVILPVPQYYLSRITYLHRVTGRYVQMEQMVFAKNLKDARITVEDFVKKELGDLMIHEIRVHETLISKSLQIS